MSGDAAAIDVDLIERERAAAGPEGYVCPNPECDGADGEVVDGFARYIPRRWEGPSTCPDCGTPGEPE